MFDHGELWHQRLAPHGRVCSAAEAARRTLEARHGEPVFVPESTFTTDDDGAARAQPPSFAACAAYAAEDEAKPITTRRMMVGLATATARTSTGGPAPRKQLLPAAMPVAAAPAVPKRTMELWEKERLVKMMDKLQPDKFGTALSIIKQSHRVDMEEMDSDEEVTIDIDTLDSRTLWKLHKYVEDNGEAQGIAAEAPEAAGATAVGGAAASAGGAQGMAAAQAPEAAPVRARKLTGGKEGARGWADSRGDW